MGSNTRQFTSKPQHGPSVPGIEAATLDEASNTLSVSTLVDDCAVQGNLRVFEVEHDQEIITKTAEPVNSSESLPDANDRCDLKCKYLEERNSNYSLDWYDSECSLNSYLQASNENLIDAVTRSNHELLFHTSPSLVAMTSQFDITDFPKYDELTSSKSVSRENPPIQTLHTMPQQTNKDTPHPKDCVDRDLAALQLQDSSFDHDIYVSTSLTSSTSHLQAVPLSTNIENMTTSSSDMLKPAGKNLRTERILVDQELRENKSAETRSIPSRPSSTLDWISTVEDLDEQSSFVSKSDCLDDSPNIFLKDDNGVSLLRKSFYIDVHKEPKGTMGNVRPPELGGQLKHSLGNEKQKSADWRCQNNHDSRTYISSLQKEEHSNNSRESNEEIILSELYNSSVMHMAKDGNQLVRTIMNENPTGSKNLICKGRCKVLSGQLVPYIDENSLKIDTYAVVSQQNCRDSGIKQENHELKTLKKQVKPSIRKSIKCLDVEMALPLENEFFPCVGLPGLVPDKRAYNDLVLLNAKLSGETIKPCGSSNLAKSSTDKLTTSTLEDAYRLQTILDNLSDDASSSSPATHPGSLTKQDHETSSMNAELSEYDSVCAGASIPHLSRSSGKGDGSLHTAPEGICFKGDKTTVKKGNAKRDSPVTQAAANCSRYNVEQTEVVKRLGVVTRPNPINKGNEWETRAKQCSEKNAETPQKLIQKMQLVKKKVGEPKTVTSTSSSCLPIEITTHRQDLFKQRALTLKHTMIPENNQSLEGTRSVTLPNAGHIKQGRNSYLYSKNAKVQSTTRPRNQNESFENSLLELKSCVMDPNKYLQRCIKINSQEKKNISEKMEDNTTYTRHAVVHDSSKLSKNYNSSNVIVNNETNASSKIERDIKHLNRVRNVSADKNSNRLADSRNISCRTNHNANINVLLNIPNCNGATKYTSTKGKMFFNKNKQPVLHPIATPPIKPLSLRYRKLSTVMKKSQISYSPAKTLCDKFVSKSTAIGLDKSQTTSLKKTQVIVNKGTQSMMKPPARIKSPSPLHTEDVQTKSKAESIYDGQLKTQMKPRQNLHKTGAKSWIVPSTNCSNSGDAIIKQPNKYKEKDSAFETFRQRTPILSSIRLISKSIQSKLHMQKRENRLHYARSYSPYLIRRKVTSDSSMNAIDIDEPRSESAVLEPNVSELIMETLVDTVKRGLQISTENRRHSREWRYETDPEYRSSPSAIAYTIVQKLITAEGDSIKSPSDKAFSCNMDTLIESLNKEINDGVDTRICWDSSLDSPPYSRSDKKKGAALIQLDLVKAGHSVMDTMTNTLGRLLSEEFDEFVVRNFDSVDPVTSMSLCSRSRISNSGSKTCSGTMSSSSGCVRQITRNHSVTSTCKERVSKILCNMVETKPTSVTMCTPRMPKSVVNSRHAVAALEDLEALVQGIESCPYPAGNQHGRCRTSPAPMIPLPVCKYPLVKVEPEIVRFETMGNATVLTTARLPIRPKLQREVTRSTSPKRVQGTGSVTRGQGHDLMTRSSNSSWSLRQRRMQAASASDDNHGEKTRPQTSRNYLTGSSSTGSSALSFFETKTNSITNWKNYKEQDRYNSTRGLRTSSANSCSSNPRCSNRLTGLAMPRKRHAVSTKNEHQHILKRSFLDKLDKIIDAYSVRVKEDEGQGVKDVCRRAGSMSNCVGSTPDIAASTKPQDILKSVLSTVVSLAESTRSSSTSTGMDGLAAKNNNSKFSFQDPCPKISTNEASRNELVMVTTTEAQRLPRSRTSIDEKLVSSTRLEIDDKRSLSRCREYIEHHLRDKYSSTEEAAGLSLDNGVNDSGRVFTVPPDHQLSAVEVEEEVLATNTRDTLKNSSDTFSCVHGNNANNASELSSETAPGNYTDGSNAKENILTNNVKTQKSFSKPSDEAFLMSLVTALATINPNDNSRPNSSLFTSSSSSSGSSLSSPSSPQSRSTSNSSSRSSSRSSSNSSARMASSIHRDTRVVIKTKRRLSIRDAYMKEVLIPLREKCSSRTLLNAIRVWLTSDLDASPTSSSSCDSSPTSDRDASPTSDRDASSTSSFSSDASPTSDRDASPTSDRDASPTSDRDASPKSGRDVSPTSNRDASPTSSSSSDASPTSYRDANPTSFRDASPTSDRDASPTSRSSSDASPTSRSSSEVSPMSDHDASPTSDRDASPTSFRDASPTSHSSSEVSPMSDHDASITSSSSSGGTGHADGESVYFSSHDTNTPTMIGSLSRVQLDRVGTVDNQHSAEFIDKKYRNKCELSYQEAGISEEDAYDSNIDPDKGQSRILGGCNKCSYIDGEVASVHPSEELKTLPVEEVHESDHLATNSLSGGMLISLLEIDGSEKCVIDKLTEATFPHVYCWSKQLVSDATCSESLPNVDDISYGTISDLTCTDRRNHIAPEIREVKNSSETALSHTTDSLHKNIKIDTTSKSSISLLDDKSEYFFADAISGDSMYVVTRSTEQLVEDTPLDNTRPLVSDNVSEDKLTTFEDASEYFFGETFSAGSIPTVEYNVSESYFANVGLAGSLPALDSILSLRSITDDVSGVTLSAVDIISQESFQNILSALSHSCVDYFSTSTSPSIALPNVNPNHPVLSEHNYFGPGGVLSSASDENQCASSALSHVTLGSASSWLETDELCCAGGDAHSAPRNLSTVTFGSIIVESCMFSDAGSRVVSISNQTSSTSVIVSDSVADNRDFAESASRETSTSFGGHDTGTTPGHGSTSGDETDDASSSASDSSSARKKIITSEERDKFLRDMAEYMLHLDHHRSTKNSIVDDLLSDKINDARESSSATSPSVHSYISQLDETHGNLFSPRSTSPSRLSGEGKSRRDRRTNETSREECTARSDPELRQEKTAIVARNRVEGLPTRGTRAFTLVMLAESLMISLVIMFIYFTEPVAEPRCD